METMDGFVFAAPSVRKIQIRPVAVVANHARAVLERCDMASGAIAKEVCVEVLAGETAHEDVFLETSPFLDLVSFFISLYRYIYVTYNIICKFKL